MMFSRSLVLTGLGVSFILGSVANADQVFWADRANLAIAFANRDGTSPGSFAAGGDPQTLTVDTLNGHVYWSDNFAVPPRFHRSNLDGTSAIEILPPAGSLIEFRTLAMEVDAVGGKLYWVGTEGLATTFLRANLDGSGEEILFSIPTPFMVVFGFALDVPNNVVYFPDGITNTVRRVNLDGSNLTVLVTLGGSGSLTEVVVDAAGKRLYWVGCQTALQSSDLLGGDIQTIVAADVTRCRTGLALDPAIGKLYWSSEEGFVSRVNTDGTGLEAIATPGSVSIEKLALDVPPGDIPAASTWGLIVLAALIATFGSLTIRRRAPIA